MDNKNLIIILIVIIILLCAVLGVMFLQSSHEKMESKIKITSDKSQYEDGKLELQLTDLNKTALSKEVLNVTITNKNGKIVMEEAVKTNSKGKAKLDLDLKKGKYTVNVTYDGNENYTASNATQKLTIKEEVKKTISSVSNSQSHNAYVDEILKDPSVKVTKYPYDICPIHGVPYWQDQYCDWFISP